MILLEEKKCWGKPLGSPNLWQSHVQTITRIETIANGINIREPGPEIFPKLHDLPEVRQRQKQRNVVLKRSLLQECVREIILRLTDYRDLEASSAAWDIMSALVAEQRVWRELTEFHFSADKISTYMEKKGIARDQADVVWQDIYHALRKCHGLKEELQYAEVLSLCRFCRCLFWPSAGHPCIADQSPEYRARLKEAGTGIIVESQPVPPAQFLKYFSL